MNHPIMASVPQAAANKLKSNQKCRFDEIVQLHKVVTV